MTPKVYGLARVLNITILQAMILLRGDGRIVAEMIDHARDNQKNRIRNAQRRLEDIDYYMEHHWER